MDASGSDPMSYTLEPEGQVVRPGSSEVELRGGTAVDSLSTHSSKELSSPSPSSGSTDDQDEEVLHHFLRMQLYHAKQLVHRFRFRGFRTMEEIANMDPSQFEVEMQMGPGDAHKLAHGLDRYRDGTFNDFYRLPLEPIESDVPVRADAAIQAGGAAGSSLSEAALRAHGGSGSPTADHDAAPQERLDLPREQPASRWPKFETMWVGSSFSSGALSMVVTAVVRGLRPCDARSRRWLEVILQLFFFHGIAMCVSTIPCLTIAHLTYGLRKPLRSIGLGCVGGGSSAVAACGAFCICTYGDCFDRSAMVLLPNRSQKRIGELGKGDRILSYNKGVFRVKRVLSRIVAKGCMPMCRIRFRLPSGELGCIETTAGHPLWVSGKGWCGSLFDNDAELETELEAADECAWRGLPLAPKVRGIQEDDIFVHHSGAAARVVSLETYSSPNPPVNLELDGPGTLFVNGILAHTSLRASGLVAA